MMRIRYALIVAALLTAGLLTACDTGVDPSPQPGVFRLLMQADPSDNTVVIGPKRYTLGNDTTEALMRVSVGQALVYRDTSYAALFRRLNSFQIEDPVVDVLAASKNGEPENHMLFESYLPPAEYDSLQLALRVNLFRVTSTGRFSYSSFENEVRLPPGASPVLTFREPFTIRSGDTTIVQLRIQPLRSLTRFQDVYYFTPQVEIESIVQR